MSCRTWYHRLTPPLISILIAGGLVSSASAWNATGHEQVADIAWTQLTQPARDEVVTILVAGDDQFVPKPFSAEGVRKAFRKAATFPDVIKSRTDTVYEPWVAPMNDRWHPAQDPTVSDSEKTRCRTWHYYDTPIRARGELPAVRESNALNALTFARAELERLQKEPNPDRRAECWWLYWIEHLAGDLHQPLHCASSYEVESKGDAGGNLFPIKNGSQRLHAFWDEGIDRAIGDEKGQGLETDVESVTLRWTSDRSHVPSTSDAQNLDVKSWIAEGAKLADTRAYEGIHPGDAPSGRYRKTASAVSSRQAVLAGYRLAYLLNTILDPNGSKAPAGGKRRK